jgi:hypothetical protein
MTDSPADAPPPEESEAAHNLVLAIEFYLTRCDDIAGYKDCDRVALAALDAFAKAAVAWAQDKSHLDALTPGARDIALSFHENHSCYENPIEAMGLILDAFAKAAAERERERLGFGVTQRTEVPRVGLDEVRDPNFTGGLSASEYLNRLREGSLAERDAVVLAREAVRQEHWGSAATLYEAALAARDVEIARLKQERDEWKDHYKAVAPSLKSASDLCERLEDERDAARTEGERAGIEKARGL